MVPFAYFSYLYAERIKDDKWQVLDLRKMVPRDSYLISDKFTPQCADPTAENAVTALYEKSAELLGTDYIDFYWIHNPVEAPKWVTELIPLAKSGKIGKIGLSNHSLEEIKEAAAIELSAEEIVIFSIMPFWSVSKVVFPVLLM